MSIGTVEIRKMAVNERDSSTVLEIKNYINIYYLF